MWATPTTALHVTFGGKARCGTTFEYGTSSDLDAYFGNDNSYLNQALQSIGRNDSLDLRKYKSFNGLLSSITISAHFRFYTATAVFSSTLPNRSIAKTFRISNDGQAVPTPLDKQQPKSFGLPRHILQSILSYATQVSGRVTVGSLADIKMATRLGAIWINRELRQDAMRSFVSSNAVTFVAYSNELHKGFQSPWKIAEWATELQKLAGMNWYCHQSHIGFPRYRERDFPTLSKDLDLVLEIGVSRGLWKLEIVRINIIGCIEVSRELPCHTMVSCRLKCLRDEQGVTKTATFTLHDLRMRVFIALSHVLMKWPLRIDQQCPNVFINGYGYAIGATFHGRHRARRERQKLDLAQLLSDQNDAFMRGARYARAISPLLQRRDSRWDALQRPKNSSSLICVWGFLRLKYWAKPSEQDIAAKYHAMY